MVALCLGFSSTCACVSTHTNHNMVGSRGVVVVVVVGWWVGYLVVVVVVGVGGTMFRRRNVIRSEKHLQTNARID